ncbi:alkaline phosphatase D family protein [Reichenbachiella sp. MALMAid0571]|uniref:alkaline phosphatase D family protein n=1 Tax=Reichenbachiella sp. MALMAid0571 TaxID=3143939 RepID=UPI0032DFA141
MKKNYILSISICTILFLQLILCVDVYGQNEFPEDVQYKKLPTEAIAKITLGNPDEVIKDMEGFLTYFPNDAEGLYCMAVAYSVKNKIPQAMEYVKKSMASGLPMERYLAGPSNLLSKLINSKEFKQYMQGRYIKLVHGPMLGDITPTGVKIWVRTDQVSSVTVKVSEDQKKWSKAFEATTSMQNEYTAITQVDGLKPSTKYYYTISIDDSQLYENGSFTTSESKGASGKLKIGFGGGAGYTPWYERMWDTLAVQSFDAFLLLGDNVYVDFPEVPEAQQYCYYRRQSRAEFRRFTPNVPIYAIWDDHDFTVNDGEGGAEIETPAWKRPVWNTFQNQWANPYYGGGKEHPGCWFDFSQGDVDFIMLDCRYYRENPKEVSDPSMLGTYQKAWLLEKLKSSTATFKIIASSVPWAIGTKPGSDDTWDGFPNEREEIFSFIEENQIDGVVLISADRHRSDAWKMQRPNGYVLYDFMSSRLTNVHTHDIMPNSLFGYNKKCSFGMLEFDTTLEDPSMTYTIKNIDNEEIHKMTVYKSELDFEGDKIKNKKNYKK